MMLVFGDGQQAGTLGGGCVEAEVKRRAIAVLSEGAPEIVPFQLDSDYGWDDGLICGGRMQVLVDPCRDPTARDYFSRLAETAESGVGSTEAIVFDGHTSGLTPTASFLFDEQGQPLTQLRTNDSVPALISDHLQPLQKRPRPRAHRGVAFLPTLPRCRLIIVGGGHVGKAVADLAQQLQFDVWVVDDREDYVSRERFPYAERHVSGKMGQVLLELEITANTYCLIVTRGHNHDEEALFHLAQRGAAYVGMIGSRRKIKLIFEDLLAEGVPKDVLDRIHAPVGLDIGSQTVPEIAVSIAAELVAHRNK